MHCERLQCRDLYDIHELLDDGNVDPLEVLHLYLRKAENDKGGRQRNFTSGVVGNV